MILFKNWRITTNTGLKIENNTQSLEPGKMAPTLRRTPILPLPMIQVKYSTQAASKLLEQSPGLFDSGDKHLITHRLGLPKH